MSGDERVGDEQDGAEGEGGGDGVAVVATRWTVPGHSHLRVLI